jgi:hypothetical protein
MLIYNSNSDVVRNAISNYNNNFDQATNLPNGQNADAIMLNVDGSLSQALALAIGHDPKWCEHNSWRILNTLDAVQSLHDKHGTTISNALRLAQENSLIDEGNARIHRQSISFWLTLASYGTYAASLYYLVYSGKNILLPTEASATIGSRLQSSIIPALKAVGFYAFSSVTSYVAESNNQDAEIRNTLVRPRLI